MLNRHSKRNWAGKGNPKVRHLPVPTFFLCILASLPAGAATTNWVDGTAYGTNYAALANAGSIVSKADGSGSLIIGSTSTTNITLGHTIDGFIAITNRSGNFSIAAGTATLKSPDYAVLAIEGGTNTITGGHFIGTTGSGGNFPPIPGQSQSGGSSISAMGGLLVNGTATVIGSEFAGAAGQNGFKLEGSSLTISNGVFRGGSAGTSGFGGSALWASDNSTVTIFGGSFTGGVGNTAFYLKDSDVTVHGGNFIGNVGGNPANLIAGDGLFSELTSATNNHVSLYGGTFSSLAFYGVDNSIQHFLAGTNLVVQNGIIQNGGTVVIDNQHNAALQQITLQAGRMEFDRDFTLGSNGVFNLFRGDLVAASNLVFGTDSKLTFVMSNGFAKVTADTATFQSNSTMQVYISSVGLAKGTNNLTLLETGNGISVETNAADTANFKSTVDPTLSTDWLIPFSDVVISNGTLQIQLFVNSWGDAWGADGQLLQLADELQTLDDGTMAAIVSAYGQEGSKTITEQTYFTTMNTFLVALQGLDAAVGQSASRGTEFRELLKLPAGAKGPETAPGNDWRGWAKYYGQFLNHYADGLNPEYDATLHGGVIGADRSFGNLLIGLSGGAGNYRITALNDAEDNMNAFHGALYGTYGAERAYLDAGIAYGHNTVETKTGGPFLLEGAFDAQVMSAYLGGGYDLVDTKGGTVFTPVASIQYSTYQQDAYSETSANAVPRNIDAFDADSLRSSIGLNVSMLNTMALETFGFKFEGRFHWLHESNPEPGNMDFRLDGGTEAYQLAYPSLDEEVYRAGFGLSCFNTMRHKPKNILLRLDFDELFGQDFNSHNLSAKVIYAF